MTEATLPADRSGTDATPARDGWRTAQFVVVITLAIGTRFSRLDSMPGEWYGDISTVYEYLLDVRIGRHPPGWYAMGIGPLFPMYLRPFLDVWGDSYLVIKVASALASLFGLALVFVTARRLVGEQFALVGTAIASVGSWWLVYSRLGDVQALTPTLTLVALYATLRASTQPASTGWTMLAGASSGLGIYLYGNTMVLPLLAAVTLAVAALSARPHPRFWLRTAAAFLVGSAVVVPFAAEAVTHAEVVRTGHVATRLELGWSTPKRLVDGYRLAFDGYVVRGDRNARGNPPRRTHLDRVSLVLAAVGIAWWLRPARRRSGIVLVGWFLGLHLPFALAVDSLTPSVSRTTAAAPFAYLFVAGGAWAIAGVATRSVASARGVTGHGRSVAAWSVAAVVALVNLPAYFVTYAHSLPLGNTPVAGLIVDEAQRLPVGSEVHVIGFGWIEEMPETKSIAYQLGDGWSVTEHRPEVFDCATVAGLARPALIAWQPSTPMPSANLTGCALEFTSVEVHTTAAGVPVYRSTVLR